MALISCPNCDKQVSELARKCPHCQTDLSIIKCPECSMEVSAINLTDCPNCGCPKEVLEEQTKVPAKLGKDNTVTVKKEPVSILAEPTVKVESKQKAEESILTCASTFLCNAIATRLNIIINPVLKFDFLICI